MNHKLAMEIIERVGLKKYAVAAACGVSPTTLSEWLHGRRNLTQQQLVRVRQFFERYMTTD